MPPTDGLIVLHRDIHPDPVDKDAGIIHSNTMQKIRALLYFEPLIFGLFFIGLLIMQMLKRAGLDALTMPVTGAAIPIPILAIGLTIGGIYGLYATIAGRWL